MTSVEDCSRRIADGIERRTTRVYVPRSVLVANLSRVVTASPVGLRLMRRQLARMVPRMEAEVERLGRAFGTHVPAPSASASADTESANPVR